MHRCLNLDEMLRLLACELVGSELKATAVSLARCCKSFENPVLHVLWETQDRLTPLLKCLPQEVWEEEDGNFVSQVMAFDLPSVLNHFVLKVFPENPDESGMG